MASTTFSPRDRPAGQRAGRAADGARAGRQLPTMVPTGGRQRRWSLALVAVLVTVGSALAFVVLWMNAGDRKPVLAMRRDVPAGQSITADDLTVVRLAVDPVINPLSASLRDDVIGEPAAVDLRAGTVLVEEHLGDDKGLAVGTTVIAVPVAIDQLPTTDLQPGDRLLLYVTAGQSITADDEEGEDAGAQQIGEGRVFAVDELRAGSSTVRVSVTVDEELVPAVAAAIHANRIYVALASSR